MAKGDIDNLIIAIRMRTLSSTAYGHVLKTITFYLITVAEIGSSWTPSGC